VIFRPDAVLSQTRLLLSQTAVPASICGSPAVRSNGAASWRQGVTVDIAVAQLLLHWKLGPLPDLGVGPAVWESLRRSWLAQWSALVGKFIHTAASHPRSYEAAFLRVSGKLVDGAR
jgi:hypothetical protein